MSTAVPKLENEAKRSEKSVAPTVKTVGSDAGEKLLASSAVFPAATVIKSPEETAVAAAAFSAVERMPPKDRLATVPLGQFRVITSLTTKFIPAMTLEILPFV